MADKDKQVKQGQEAQNIYREGEIVSVNPAKCTARVKFLDADETVSYDLRVGQQTTVGNMKRNPMPKLGQQVVCLFKPNGQEEGVILAALYNEKDAPPTSSEELDISKYEDGTVISYDPVAHKLVADVKGDIDVKATGNIAAEAQGNMNLKAPTMTLEAQNMTLQAQTMTVSGGSVSVGGSGPVEINGNPVNVN